MRLATKLLLLFGLFSVIPIAVVGYMSYRSGRNTIETTAVNHLVSTNILKKNELSLWMRSGAGLLAILVDNPFFKRELTREMAQHSQGDPGHPAVHKRIIEDYFSPQIGEGTFFELFIMRAGDGLVLVSTDPKQEGKYFDNQPFFIQGQRGLFIQNVYYSMAIQQMALTISAPIKDGQGSLLAVAAGRVNLSTLSEIMEQRSGLSRTEDTYLVNKFNFFVTEPKFGKGFALKKSIHTYGVEEALTKRSGVGFYGDYRGVPVIGAYDWIPEWELCIITEVDQEEAYAPIYALQRSIALFGLGVAVLAVFSGWLCAVLIVKPVKEVVKGAAEVGRGNLDYKFSSSGSGEIGELSMAFERMIQELKDTMVSRDLLQVEVAEREQAEDTVRRLNKDLEKRVIERTEQLESFSYSVAHDLRAPLRAIDGFSRIVLEDYGPRLDDEGKRLLKVIQSNTQKMGRLIDDLLLFSRTGQHPLNCSEINMTEIATSVVDELMSAGDGKAPAPEIRLGNLADTVADPGLVKQVWMNLLSNAIKFSRDKEPAVIEVDSRAEGHEQVYRVRDNGVGFDMAYAHKLFRVFHRLHAATEYEGNGIGLALVQRVVSRHGGRVWAEGAVNQGACFYFTLPTKENSL
jgi:signal transduction histidine kinase